MKTFHKTVQAEFLRPYLQKKTSLMKCIRLVCKNDVNNSCVQRIFNQMSICRTVSSIIYLDK